MSTTVWESDQSNDRIAAILNFPVSYFIFRFVIFFLRLLFMWHILANNVATFQYLFSTATQPCVGVASSLSLDVDWNHIHQALVSSAYSTLILICADSFLFQHFFVCFYIFSGFVELNTCFWRFLIISRLLCAYGARDFWESWASIWMQINWILFVFSCFPPCYYNWLCHFYKDIEFDSKIT